MHNNWAKLLLIAEFIYNNGKNISTNHTPFDFNCSYYLRDLFEDNADFCSRSCSGDKLAGKLKS